MEVFQGQYFSENSLKLTMMRKPSVRMSLLQPSSDKSSRFMRIKLDSPGASLSALAQYLAELSKKYSIANADLSQYKSEKLVYLACHDLRAFDTAHTLLLQYFSPKSSIEPLEDIASFEYTDSVLVIDSSSLESSQVRSVFFQFGDIWSVDRAALGKYVVRYFDCRSLQKIESYKRLRCKVGYHKIKLSKQEEVVLMKSHTLTESNWISVYFHLVNPYKLRQAVSQVSNADKENRGGHASLEKYYFRDLTNKQLSLFTTAKQHMESDFSTWTAYSNQDKLSESGISKQQQLLNKIDLGYVEVDGRCSLMIKNIPNSVLVREFIDIVNMDFEGLYDFIYLPMDFKNKCNLGYAFINLVNPRVTKEFVGSFEGRCWKSKASNKVCNLRYAAYQGRNQMLMNFRRGGVFKTAQQLWRSSESSIDFLPEYCDFLPRVMPSQSEDSSIF